MANVKPVPEGYHTATPFLSMRDTRKMIEFYKEAFGATSAEVMESNGRVVHAEINIGDSKIMLGEEAPEKGCEAPLDMKTRPSSIYLYVENVDEVFATAIKAGAKEEAAPQDQFWGDRIGTLIDPSGHQWHVATRKENLTTEQTRERMEKAYAPPAQNAEVRS